MLDAHFVVEQAGRYRGGWLFQFNGTGGIWRREAIAEGGGWSSDSLVEDLDLTIRVELAGWHGLFMMEPAIPGLVPERISHWRVQQRRWSTGFIEVARKLLPKIWRAPWTLGFKLSAAFLIFVQVFYACVATGIVALVAAVALRGGDVSPYYPELTITLSAAFVIAVGLTLLPYLALRRGPLWRYCATLVLVPPAMIFISLSQRAVDPEDRARTERELQAHAEVAQGAARGAGAGLDRRGGEKLRAARRLSRPTRRYVRGTRPAGPRRRLGRPSTRRRRSGP